MSSAQLDVQVEDGSANVPVEGAASALRQQAAERLAAHRQRRARQAAVTEAAPVAARKPRPQAGSSLQAAERVAERYARTPSFRAALADEARRAMEQAAAEAEVALRNAEAVAAAQQKLLAELIQYDMQVPFTAETALVHTAPEPEPEPVRKVHTGGLTVKLYEDTGRAETPAAPELTHNLQMVDLCPDEAAALDEEIAFRQAPVFEDYAGLLAAAIAAVQEPPVPLPANLLEFPRHLVASRKARPRLAEGPLRDDAPRSPQLRIFEVEPEQVATEAEPMQQQSVWSSIVLGAHTVTEPVEDPDAPTAVLASLLPPQVAPMTQRLLAVTLDATLVLAAFTGFVAAAAETATQALHTPVGLGAPAVAPLAAFAAVTLALFWLMYQGLFYTFAGETPGMRYARIGLCTFSDENPSRSAMRRRILAQVVAICPLGLGIVWVLLDDDRLGWHDRISRMYQRAY